MSSGNNHNSSGSSSTVKLIRTGDDMPLLGLGTWKAPKGEVAKALNAAIKVGYRLIDCAADYGNEEEVGSALQDILTQGFVGRKDIFVTSKLWNTFHARENVRIACLKTLSDL